MPVIDVYAAVGLFPTGSDRQLGEALGLAVLRAEGITVPGPVYGNSTAVYIHHMPASTVQTVATAEARTARVQITTPPGLLSREGQKQIVKEATEIVAQLANDATLTERTLVVLIEAAEGGWGMAGIAFGKEEFVGLAVRANVAAP